MCAVTYLRKKPKENSAHLAVVIGKSRVAAMRPLLIPRLELHAAVMAVRFKQPIVMEREKKIYLRFLGQTQLEYFIGGTARILKNVFVANGENQISDKTDVSQRKIVSSISNPADIGTRVINIEELK